MDQVLTAGRGGVIVGDTIGGALTLLPKRGFDFVDLALNFFDARIIGTERRRQLGMLAFELRETFAQILNQLVLENSRQGSELACLNQAVERFLFVSLGLRFGQLFLELLQPLVCDVLTGTLVRFKEDQAIAPRVALKLIFGFFQFYLYAHQLLRKPLRGSLCGLPPCFQALIDIIRGKRIDNARGKFRIARVKSNSYKAAAIDGIDGQAILKPLKDSLGQLPIRGFGRGTDCKGARRGRFFLPWPKLPPLGRVEFVEGFQLKLVDHPARQAFAGQNAVLRPQVGIGHSVEFIHFLDRRDVRIFFLNLQQDLSPIDRLLFEGGDENASKQNEKDDEDCGQPLAKDAAIAAEVERLARFQDFVGIRQLQDAAIESAGPTPIKPMAAAIKLDLILVVHILTNGK